MRLSLCQLVSSILLANITDCMAQELPSQLDWWQPIVFYQIYPRSFRDTNDDGSGDLNGITQNMDHFVDAGVGAIWMSPIYQSPMVDFGYDISDFREIDSTYGTLEDFDTLVSTAHGKGLKVILDFVPNHASNESNYFQLSLNRTQGYEDFFIWDDGILDPSDNQTRLPPSNWESAFGGSAWEWREERQQFYLHQFAIQQVDFNYRNPAVMEEMYSILTFWFDRGVDGFRVDAVPYLVEAEKDGDRYPDNPRGSDGNLNLIYTKDLDENYDIVFQWREFFDNYSRTDGVTRLMMTEAYANLSRVLMYYGNETEPGSQVPFNFGFITEVNNNSNAEDFVNAALRWLENMPENRTANWVLGNHDRPRVASRFGPHMADTMNMLNLLLPGVAITYQGEEIALENGYVSYEDTVDIQACNAGRQGYEEVTRDPSRTPFQWDNSTNAGFSNASETWLPVAENYEYLNLRNQKESNHSHFTVYQALTDARNHPTIQLGDYDIRPLTENILVLLRTMNSSDTFVLVSNVGDSQEVADLSSYSELPDFLTVYVSSVNSTANEGDEIPKNNIELQRGESVVFVTPPN